MPTRATNGSQAAWARTSPYSLDTPGRTKPRVAGFMVSMIRARVRTPIMIQLEALSFASGWTAADGADACGPVSDWARGIRP